MARVIPVIDILGGRVVRAVGGRRAEYRPVVSRLTSSTDPVEVARVLVGATGAAEVYVADLDAIGGHPRRSPNTPVIARMTRHGIPAWVDYGHREDCDEADVVRAGAAGLILGTETMISPETLFHSASASREATPVILSLDLNGSHLRVGGAAWEPWTVSPLLELLRLAVSCGIAGVLVLDVTAVGEGTGPVTGAMCRRIRAAFPDLPVWTGGGVRGWDDVRRLEDAGADGILVASALHDGRLTLPRP